jgi:hypothetical protein
MILASVKTRICYCDFFAKRLIVFTARVVPPVRSHRFFPARVQMRTLERMQGRDCPSQNPKSKIENWYHWPLELPSGNWAYRQKQLFAAPLVE